VTEERGHLFGNLSQEISNLCIAEDTTSFLIALSIELNLISQRTFDRAKKTSVPISDPGTSDSVLLAQLHSQNARFTA
jgi:hypothetical protein